ncbi:glycosyltransferase family 39 protein [Cellulomonas sp. B6]|uniref:glycosyltransferase family 39 protein n=1 Tax=Cellulomonas sp. B6 TaxID=1295626 RepID=UPI00073B259B|nr:glycosyltransferase family 39 protein [Cellulomonas sp. B6]KSW30064.1 hypothetical protein ATM99_04870 [Cellulomonas sp. B6]
MTSTPGSALASSSTVHAVEAPAASGRRGRLLALAPVVLVVVWTVLNTWWSLSRLDDRAFNIDEAGYLAFAANHAYGFAAQGVGGWFDSVLAPSQHAPGVPVLTSLLVIAGAGIDQAGLAVIGVSGGVMLLFTWLLVREVVNRTAGWLALALLATAPAVLNYSHLYTFVLPTAALLAVALYAVHRSRGATVLRWVVVLGVVLGCLPLVRSMNFAFAGILGMILVVQAALTPGPARWRALRHVALAAGVAALVLLPWLWSSWRLVAEYLFGFGYGDRAEEYGSRGGSAYNAVRMTASELYAIHTSVILIGVVAAAVVMVVALVRWVRSGDAPHGWSAFAAAPVFPAAALTVAGYAALGTTANSGSGFGFQLAPAFVTVACLGWVRLVAVRPLASRPLLPAVVVAVLALACAVPATGLLSRVAPWGTDRVTELPVIGGVRVTAGVDLDESYLEIANGDGPVNRSEWSDEWREASEDLAGAVAHDDFVASGTAFGFRGYFVNANTLQLEVLRDGHWALPVVQIEPAVVPEDEAAYLEWLTDGPAGSACQLVTSAGADNEFQPMVDTTLMEAAAAAADFERVESFDTPDGRSMDLWRRDRAECAVAR